MKKYIFTLLAAVGLTFTACEDYLDRPQKNTPTDETFWKTESDARMFSYSFYANYFVGYNSGWSTAFGAGPYCFYKFNDDIVSTGTQSNFENSVPSSRGSSSETMSALSEYSGANWNFAWVRKANIFMERLEQHMKGNVADEVYNHWHAVGAFFKCYSYSRLVNTFGDVPYFERSFTNAERDIMFKDRDSRTVVMDAVYDLCKNEVLVNMRENDGDNLLNRYVAAAFISRWFLFEGTWQKYVEKNETYAKKYLEFAKEAAEIVMNSGKYAIATPFREVFGSQDLKGNSECLMYRHYTSDYLKHCTASYSNGKEGQSPSSNLALAKSFICQDGKVYQNSALENAAVLSVPNMAATRDPRFEATFVNEASIHCSSMLYACKFIDREALTMDNPGATAIYGSNTNTNDAPVIRYAEVLLNWIEAKAELALMGGAAVVQDDLDKSVNQLRRRPLDATAIERGVVNTADMKLVDITADFDPARDKGEYNESDYEVDPLIWEIRRERRMELVYEHSRLLDIKRWKKLHYMDNEKFPDTMLGPWVDFPTEVPSYFEGESQVGKLQVKKEDGTVVTYDGTNKDAMVGYYIPTNAKPRNAFTDRSYMAPIGEQQMVQYSELGYKLTQTKGWE